MNHEGACHCGSVMVWFQTATPAEDVQVRACQCDFCRRHGARTIGDPDGMLEVRAAPGSLRRYRFGTQSADFLLCRECGCFMAAVMDEGDGAVGVLNVAGARIRAFLDREPAPVDYDAEEKQGRQDRRRQRWTPTTVVEAMPNA